MAFYGSKDGAFAQASQVFASSGGQWVEVPLGGGNCEPGYYALGGTGNSGVGGHEEIGRAHV